MPRPYRSRAALSILTAFTLVAAPGVAAASPPALVSVPSDVARPADARARLRAEAGPQASFVDRPGFAGVFMASAMQTRPRSGSPSDVARAFLREHGAAFGIGGSVEVALESERVVAAIGFVRLRRIVSGEPVMGESMVVRVLPGGIVDHVTARLSDAPVERVARTIELADAATRAMVAARRTEVESSRPVRVLREGRIVPAWEVVVAGRSIMEDRYAVYVDARDGAPLGGRFMTLHATGRVYDPNPVVAEMMTSEPELTHLTSREHLTGRYIRAQNCVSRTGECAEMQVATADVDGNFLYDPVDPSFDDPFAEVMAYYHGNRVAAYFRDTHEFEWRCAGASSSVMPATVNLHSGTNTPYDNAAYSSGSCAGLIFGQGERDFAYDGDVVYHEFTHGVVDQTAGLSGVVAVPWGLSYDPLALNEGTADYFSATVSDDPELAEYLSIGSFGGEFSSRSAENDLRCPHDLFGEGHYDGRIWNATGWDIREAVGAEKADAIVYAALNTFTDAADFDEAGLALVSTGMAFETMGMLSADERGHVERVVGERGLVECEGIVPIADGDNKRGFSGSSVFGRFYGNIAPLLYRIDIPPDARTMVLEIRPITVTGDYSIVLTQGRVPRNRGAELRGDFTFDSGELLFDSRSTPPIEPCGTWYVGLVVNDLDEGESAYGVSLEIIRTSEIDGGGPAPTTCEALDAGAGDAGTGDDAGTDEDAGTGEDAGTDEDAGRMDAGPTLDMGTGGGGGDDDDGCGCSTPGRAPTHSGLAILGLLAALGAVVVTRRRRR